MREAGISHARRMDHMYRYQRHFYDVTRKYYLFGRDTLIREMNPASGPRCSKSAAAPGVTWRS